MMMRKLLPAIALVGFWAIASVQAQTLFVPETFGDGGIPSANGWSTGGLGSVDADAGENGAGDHVVNYGTAGGFHFLHPAGGVSPNANLLGDYFGAGATAIRFNARHSGAGDTVALRATLFTPALSTTEWAQSANPVVLTPNDTNWQTYELSLLPDDLQSNGLPTVDLLANVAQVGLRHDPAGLGPGNAAFVNAETNVLFDDVMLVPEPTALGLLFGCIVALAFRNKHSKRWNSEIASSC